MLYHYQVYWPETIAAQLPSGKHRLVFGRHARERINERKLKGINSYIDFERAKFVEAELKDNQLAKLVVRIHLTNSFDLILVLCPEPSWFFVKTLWINAKGDNHKTLDTARYCPL